MRAQPAVERAQGLVEQKRARLEHDGAGQRHALLLAAGELRRIGVVAALELHQVEHIAHPPRDLALGIRRSRSG